MAGFCPRSQWPLWLLSRRPPPLPRAGQPGRGGAGGGRGRELPAGDDAVPARGQRRQQHRWMVGGATGSSLQLSGAHARTGHGTATCAGMAGRVLSSLSHSRFPPPAPWPPPLPPPWPPQVPVHHQRLLPGGGDHRDVCVLHGVAGALRVHRVRRHRGRRRRAGRQGGAPLPGVCGGIPRGWVGAGGWAGWGGGRVLGWLAGGAWRWQSGSARHIGAGCRPAMVGAWWHATSTLGNTPALLRRAHAGSLTIEKIRAKGLSWHDVFVEIPVRRGGSQVGGATLAAAGSPRKAICQCRACCGPVITCGLPWNARHHPARPPGPAHPAFPLAGRPSAPPGDGAQLSHGCGAGGGDCAALHHHCPRLRAVSHQRWAPTLGPCCHCCCRFADCCLHSVRACVWFVSPRRAWRGRGI